MLISIVVTSYSSGRLDDIRDLLRSIKIQKEENYELVYVTERDINLRRMVAREAQDIGLRVRVFHNDGRPGLAEARNLGAKAATGEILGFVDDDVVLDSGWTKAVEETFQANPKLTGITGPAYPLWVGESAKWLPAEFDWLIGCTRWFNSPRLVEVRNCWGMNMAFRKSTFNLSGGFSEDTGYHRGWVAEDVELSLRIQDLIPHTLAYVPTMVVKSKIHPYRLENRFVIERSRWIGHSRRRMKMLTRKQPFAAEFEGRLLVKLVRSLLIPRTDQRFPFEDFRKRYSLAILSLSSVILGYAIGP